MALRESIRKANKEKAYTRRYGLKLNTNTDKDIIAWLEKQPSMQGAARFFSPTCTKIISAG